jgi:hypothetical protein
MNADYVQYTLFLKIPVLQQKYRYYSSFHQVSNLKYNVVEYISGRLINMISDSLALKISPITVKEKQKPFPDSCFSILL